MPLTRYQIRNEYSLADPELYRAADKDDPEALLEGVAMAGLVGVLRQLGDLAEFAAEIFHDLHEEVMATAARGHGLVVRVQQLEAEFPAIEKAFLSQTSHSLFFYNTGVDWHPNLHMDQNLITQGDLPRFVMDSYEECRGPPRLFLLDKFDVAGAGSCLKRYTDPSFFKVDSSSCGMTDAEVQREKKPRKAKKKGSRWRNGETPEVLPTSHAKLHQLFLEESVENHVNDPSRRVKLKRRLNGFPFDSKSGKSYMEKFLKSPTHDHNAVHDISVNSSPLKLPSTITGESGIEIYDIITVSPHEELPQRKRSPFSSLDAEESSNKRYMDELNEESNDEILEAPRSNCVSQACNGVSNLHEDVDEKEIAVDGERKRRSSLDSYQSDDIGSEVDNYMDALATMDSEMETDSEYRGKNDMCFLNMDNQGMDSDANEEQQGFQAHCSDTQSIGNSTATDDGNNSSQKGIYSFPYSYSPSNLAENTLSDGDTSVKILSSSEMCEAEIANMPSDQLSANEENASTQAPQHTVCNGVCIEESNLPSHRSHFGQPASSSCLTESNPTLFPLDQRKNLMEDALLGLESDEVSSHHKELGTEYYNVEENSSCPIDNLPCSFNITDDPSLTRDNFHPQVSPENRSVVELDNEDPYVLSHVSAHLSNILEFPGRKSSENLVDDVYPAECAEHECHRILADSQIDSPQSIASHTEVLNIDLGQPEVETCDRDMEPDGIAVDFKKQQFPGISENILPRESSSYSKEECPEESSSSAHSEDLDGFSPNIDMVGGDAAEVNFSSHYQNPPDPLSGLDGHLDDVAIETAHSKMLTEDTVVTGICCYNNGDDRNSVSSSPRRLQEETISITQDLCQDGMEINEAGSLEHLQESAIVKEVDQQAGDSSNLDPSDASTRELLNVIPDSSLSAISGNGLHTAGATTVPLISYQQDQLSESKSGQQIDIFESAENTTPLPAHDLTELRTPSDQKVELHDSQVVMEPWHQDSELQSSQQINVIDSVEDTSSSTNHYVAERGTPMAEKSELQDGHFDEEPWRDQDAESNSAQQINAIESTKSTSSTTCHVAELRIPSEQKVELHDDHLCADSGYDQYLKSKSSWQIDVIMDKGDVESSHIHDIAGPKPPLEQKVELQYEDQFDLESAHADKRSSEPFSLVEQIRFPTDLDQESHTDDFSEVFVSSLPSQPSVSELLPLSDIHDRINKPSSSTLPSFDIHAGISQINLNEMPPLPPLPPMQWRMGKVQHSFLASKRDPVGGNPDSFLHVLPSTADENVMEGKITQPSNPFLPLIDLEDEKSKPGHDNLEDYYMVHPNSLPLQVPPEVNHGNTQNLFPNLDGAQCTNPFLEMQTIHTEEFLEMQTIHTEGSEHGFLTSEGGMAQPSVNPFCPVNNIEDTVSTYSSRTLPDNKVQLMHQSLPDTTLEDKQFEETAVISGEKLVDPPETASPSKIQDEQPEHMFSTLDGQTAWSLSAPVPIPHHEDGKPNGERQVKLPRPRNPLIDAVAAIDKSKLRKVSERVWPQVGQKVDERDSLLEQIRTKSFNLKPALASRPSIQGPKTNLKVTAILEKANAIRQAFAGSDEDDSDGWSDS